MNHTYSQSFKPDNLIFEMAKESAQIYNRAIELHKQRIHFKYFGKIIDKEIKTQYLICESKQASYQQFCKDFTAYSRALATYRVDPSRFSGEPKPPHKKNSSNLSISKKTLSEKETAIFFYLLKNQTNQ